MKPFKQRFLILLTLLGCSLSQGVLAGEAMESARKIVNSSLAAAKQDASYLVRQDLESVLLQLVQEAQSGANSSLSPMSTDAVLEKLEQEALRIAETKVPDVDLTQQKVSEIWEQYKKLVRERMAASYVIQDQIQHSDQIFKNLSHALESFSGVCKTGRSQAGIDYVISPIPSVCGKRASGGSHCGPEYSVHIGMQYNGQSSFDVKMESYSGTPEDKNRLTTGQVLYTAASVNASIAYSGATGAVVTKAAALNPYLLGAVIVYGVVSHVLAAEDHAKLLNEIAKANRFMYEHTATEKDVARFYRESCQTIEPIISKLQESLVQLQGSAAQRAELVARAKNSQEERNQFSVKSDEMVKTREWLLLYYAAKSERCLNQTKQEPKETATCVLSEGNFQSLRDPDIKIGSDLSKVENDRDQKKKELEDFATQYPLEKRAGYVADTLIDYLAPEWEMTESYWMQFSFQAVDAMMNSAFQRLLLLLGQYRLEKSKEWNNKSDALFADQRLTEEFERLKGQYRQLVGDGIRVLFNHLNRQEFQKKVRVFLKDANGFIKKGYSEKSVLKFSSLVKNFERIYIKL